MQVNCAAESERRPWSHVSTLSSLPVDFCLCQQSETFWWWKSDFKGRSKKLSCRRHCPALFPVELTHTPCMIVFHFRLTRVRAIQGAWMCVSAHLRVSFGVLYSLCWSTEPFWCWDTSQTFTSACRCCLSQRCQVGLRLTVEHKHTSTHTLEWRYAGAKDLAALSIHIPYVHSC